MKLSKEKRIEYYTGGIKFSCENTPFDFESYELFDHPFSIDAKNKECRSRRHYDKDLIRYVKLAGFRKLWFCCGDKPYTGNNFPVLVKTRDTFNQLSRGVIANLNSGRHWDLNLSQDVAWADKLNDVYWRGADTGHELHNNDRVNFVSRFFGKYDVAFSDYSQNYIDSPYLYSKEWLKGFCSREDFLKRKYLPVIDGNDKSSSLNWVLASNSIPIMPKPRFHSWLCEKFLESGVHYVEVERDFSDFEEKLDWCKSHDEECKIIAGNGSQFIKDNFTDMAFEIKVERDMIEYFHSTIEIFS
jgi:hypothetical protein